MWDNFVLPLMAGIVLLIIEYHTNWFAGKASLPSLRTILKKVQYYIAKPLSVFSIRAKQLLAVLGPWLVIVVNVVLLSPEPREYPVLLGCLVALLVVLSIIIESSVPKPTGNVLAIILIGNVFLLLTLFSGNQNLETSAYFPRQLSNPDIDDSKTVILICFTMMFMASWIITDIIRQASEQNQKLLRGRIELLYQLPATGKLINAFKNSLLSEIRSKWIEFLAHLRTKNNRAADAIQHFVPVSVKEHRVQLGCITKMEIQKMNDQGESQKFRYPSATSIIENEMRTFFGNEFIDISLILIDEAEYKAVAQVLSSKRG